MSSHPVRKMVYLQKRASPNPSQIGEGYRKLKKRMVNIVTRVNVGMVRECMAPEPVPSPFAMLKTSLKEMSVLLKQFEALTWASSGSFGAAKVISTHCFPLVLGHALVPSPKAADWPRYGKWGD